VAASQEIKDGLRPWLLLSSSAARTSSRRPPDRRPGIRLPALVRGESDVLRLPPLLALGGLEQHLRVLAERHVALAADRAVVDVQVLAAFIGDDEPVPLVGVEPLHGPGCHTPPPLLRNGQRRRNGASGTR